MNLSAHFSIDELVRSDYAARHNIDNSPDAEVLSNLYMLAAGLERVRDVIGHPIHVSSGYRCPKLNTAIGSKPSSQHLLGLAADFTCPGLGTPEDVVVAILERKQVIDYDQMILEYPGRGGWVHISFSDSPRRQALVYDGHTYKPMAVS
jgi:hypothetical protein